MSVSWRVNGERVSVLGWGRAILLQLAHPLVAAGVGAHSTFRGAPHAALSRFDATRRAMLALTFGTDDEARATVARIRGVHDHVHGGLPVATAAFRSGTSYTAHDPSLLAWVNLTLLDSVPLAYGRLVAPLDDEAIGRYASESRWGAELIGVRPGDVPTSAIALRTHMDEWLRGGQLEVTETARQVAGAMLRPSLSWIGGPIARLHTLSAIGWLPEELRQAYGFSWTTADARALDRWCLRLQAWSRRAPPRLRRWAAARRAERRDTRQRDR